MYTRLQKGKVMYFKNSILILATLSLFSGCDIDKDEYNYYRTPNSDGSDKNITLNINYIPTTDGIQRATFSFTDGNRVQTSENMTITIREHNVSNRVDNNRSQNSTPNVSRDKNSSVITPVTPNIKDTSALTTYPNNNNFSNTVADKNISETTNSASTIKNPNISNSNTINNDLLNIVKDKNSSASTSTIEYPNDSNNSSQNNNFSTVVKDKNITTTINTPTIENPNSVTTSLIDEDNSTNDEPDKSDSNNMDNNIEDDVLIKDNNISKEPTSQLPTIIDAGKNKSVTVNSSVTLIGTGVVKYEWKEGDNILATTAIFNYTPKSTGEHTLTFSITDLDGLVYTDVVTVMANETNSTHK